jgi:hypothetical protein
MYPIRPNHQRAKHVITAFYILIGFSVLEASFAAWQYYMYSNFDFNDMDLFYTVLMWKAIISFTSLGIYIVAGVLFILWFRRAYYNLNVVNPEAASFPEGWAAGAWFVPFLNLVRPFQIMKEIWTGTQNAIPHRLPENRPATLVGFWWALYLISGITAYVLVFWARQGFSDVSELLSYTTGEVLRELISIAAAIVALQVIKKVSSFEAALWEEAQNPSDSVFAITAAQVPPAPPAS